jgi:hypothetical protein
MVFAFLRSLLRRGSRPRPVARPHLMVEALEQRNLLDAGGFIRGLYTDILHRDGGDGEVNGWVSALQRGTAPTAIVRTFVESAENHAHIIINDYQTLLGRTPGPDEVSSWLRQLAAGVTPDQMEAGFVSSAEYSHRHGDNDDGWLNGIYHDLLHRDGDGGSKAGWETAMQHGLTRTQIATLFVSSHERHDLEVHEAFEEILHREPDDGARHTFDDALDHGLDRDHLREDLAEANEFGDDHGFHAGDDNGGSGGDDHGTRHG